MLMSLLNAVTLNTPSMYAQSGGQITQKTDVWQVHYWVTVEGDFKKEPELGSGDPTIYYHIKRRYEGTATLRFLPITGDPQSAIRYPQFKGGSKIFISIKDFRNTIYDPICEEFQSIEEYWDADVYGFAQNTPTLLLINNEKRVYKTSFPILYTLSDPLGDPIVYSRKEIMNKNGTRKVTSDKTERLPFSLHEYPKVTRILENASIIRTHSWSDIKRDAATPDSYYWLSEVLHPDEPLIPDVPESKNKVNIRVFYEFKKI